MNGPTRGNVTYFSPDTAAAAAAAAAAAERMYTTERGARRKREKYLTVKAEKQKISFSHPPTGRRLVIVSSHFLHNNKWREREREGNRSKLRGKEERTTTTKMSKATFQR